MTKKPAAITGTENSDRKITVRTAAQRDAIVDYLSRNVTAENSVLAELLGLKSDRVRIIINEMIEDGIVVASGEKTPPCLQIERVVY